MSEDSHRRATFPTTRISLIMAARDSSGPHAQQALSLLCQAYWYPIYAFVRRLGYPRHEAEDLTQGFFARVLEKRYLRNFDHDRGRFRSYLLGSLKHFAANAGDHARALKRGGGVAILSLDAELDAADHRYRLEPQTDLTPEKIFERAWALAVLARVEARLREQEAREGKGDRFERLRPYLTGEVTELGYRELASNLQTTEGALKVAIHRMRRRFRDLLRAEIAQTVADGRDVGDELRYLLAALRI